MKFTGLMTNPRFQLDVMDLQHVIRNGEDFDMHNAMQDFEDDWDVLVETIDAEVGGFVIALDYGKHYIIVASEHTCPSDMAAVVVTRAQLRMCYLDEEMFTDLYNSGFDILFEQPIGAISEIVEDD